jgi:hypothetical protein
VVSITSSPLPALTLKAPPTAADVHMIVSARRRRRGLPTAPHVEQENGRRREPSRDVP